MCTLSSERSISCTEIYNYINLVENTCFVIAQTFSGMYYSMKLCTLICSSCHRLMPVDKSWLTTGKNGQKYRVKQTWKVQF